MRMKLLGDTTIAWVLPLEAFHFEKARKIPPCVSDRGRRKVTTLKYAQTVFHNKGLFFDKINLPRALFHFGKGHVPD